MKVGIITTPNVKGQIVIPKVIREALKIGPNTPVNLQLRGDGIYIHPIREIITDVESENSYGKILALTQGALGAKPYYKNEKLRRKIELQAARRRKQKW